MSYFPVIWTEKRKGKTEGYAALKLNSILQRELLMSDSREGKFGGLERFEAGRLQQSRETFVRMLTELDPALSLELVMSAFPSLSHPADNRLEIVLYICGDDRSEEALKEKIVSAFLRINPLLSALYPEADFRPVTSMPELQSMHNGDVLQHAVSVDRRTAVVALDTLFPRKPIGFGGDGLQNNQITEKQRIRHLFQWIPSHNDWSQLIRVMLNQLDPSRLLIRIKSAPISEDVTRHLNDIISICDRFLIPENSASLTLKEQAGHIRQQTLSRMEKLMQESFQVGEFLLTSTMHNGILAKMVGSAVTASRSTSEHATFWEGGFRITDQSLEKVVQVHWFPDDGRERFTAEEAACAFRLPNPPLGEAPPGFPLKRFRTAMAMIRGIEKDEQAIVLAENIHQGLEKPLLLNIEDRLRHCFIMGKTGMGKSTLMKQMILQDIQAGRGVALFDPHDDMISDILGKIPVERLEDVILFDPLDNKRPVGFNVLEWHTIEERDLIIDELYEILNHMYDFSKTGGPFFELYFRGALALLMGDKKRDGFVPTLLDLPLFFLDKGFRRFLAGSVDDRYLHDFLDQAESISGEGNLQNASAYITSKLMARIQGKTLQRILGQSRMTFSFDDIMDTRKIVLIKLGRGKFGHVTASFLANMIVSRLKLAAMRRGKQDGRKRPPFFIYIDEAHNLPSENFMELLSEARKFGVGLVMATQYAAQLSRQSISTPETVCCLPCLAMSDRLSHCAWARKMPRQWPHPLNRSLVKKISSRFPNGMGTSVCSKKGMHCRHSVSEPLKTRPLSIRLWQNVSSSCPGKDMERDGRRLIR